MRLLIGCSALLLTGCSTVGVVPAGSLSSVQPGMTRTEVVSLLGEPGGRGFQGQTEALQYCKKQGGVANSDEYTTVWLTGGRVTGLTTDRKAIILTSCDGFPEIKWSLAPK